MPDDALAPLAVLELRPLGGALARAPEGAGALATLEGASRCSPAVQPSTPRRPPGSPSACLTCARLAPWTAPRALLNSSGGIDPASGYDAGTWERLLRVRDAFDPERMLVSNHPIVS